jgi:hypothetical protein
MTLLLVLKSTLRITLFQQALFSERMFQKEVVEENNEIRQGQTTSMGLSLPIYTSHLESAYPKYDEETPGLPALNHLRLQSR